MDFEELIRQDFEHLSKTTELDVSKDSEDAILMQSVEGHGHNGAGMFHKRRFVNITISDIVTALELDPEKVKAYRQKLIDENLELNVLTWTDRTAMDTWSRSALIGEEDVPSPGLVHAPDESAENVSWQVPDAVGAGVGLEPDRTGNCCR